MRKILLSILALTGLALASAVPASANAAGAIVLKPAVSHETGLVKAGWRHRHHRGFSIGFGYGYGYPRYRYWGYPRYAYYDDYYYRPRYYRPRYYSYYAPRHHRRHWCSRHDRWEWR